MEYPKIQTLFKRHGCGEFDEEKKRYASDLEKKPRKSDIIEGEYSCEEFQSINRWTITEKVDGTNVRIILDRKDEKNRLDIRGRTDNAQFPTFLMSKLQDLFSYEKVSEVFKDSNYVILFGEGYGEKIQSGGYYRKDSSFILFDVYCSGWWLDRQSVIDIANQLNIEHVPLIPKINMGSNFSTSFWSTQEIVDYIKSRPSSLIATVQQHEMEGIIARSYPPMNFRKGGQIMFKLKCKDFK